MGIFVGIGVAVVYWQLVVAVALIAAALGGAIWVCIAIDNHRRNAARRRISAACDDQDQLILEDDARGIHGHAQAKPEQGITR